MGNKNKSELQKDFLSFMEKYMSEHSKFNIFIPREKGLHYIHKIRETLESGGSIMIFGDYDADGIASTAYKKLMIEKLAEALNIETPVIEFKIPTRAEHYGIKDYQLKAYQKIYDLIITSDNGTHSGFYEKLKDEDFENLLIVDHHPLIDPTVPRNQQRSIDDFSSKVSVINPNTDGSVKISTGILDDLLFRLMRDEIPELKKITKPNEFSDLAAITLISDMADSTNPIVRKIIKEGIDRINDMDRAIYQYLFPSFGGINNKRIIPEDISFKIAPLINSGPRLSSAVNEIVYLLCQPSFSSEDRKSKEYRSFSKSMDILIYTNELRKEVTSEFTENAMEIAEEYLAKNENTNLLAIRMNESPIGINGLVAGNIASRYGIPTIILSENIFGKTTMDGKTELVGSGRGEGIKELLSYITSGEKDLKEGVNFGGHNMAIGITVYNWDKFIQEVNTLNQTKYKNLELSHHEIFGDRIFSLDEYRVLCNLFGKLTGGIDIDKGIYVHIKAKIVGFSEYRNNFTKVILKDDQSEDFLTILSRVPSSINKESLDSLDLLVSLSMGDSDDGRFVDILNYKNARFKPKPESLPTSDIKTSPSRKKRMT